MALLLLSAECEESNKNKVMAGGKLSNYLIIKQKLYPTPYVKQFTLTKDSLKVSIINANSKKDSMLLSKNIDTLVLTKLNKEFTKLTDSIYENKCTSDGLVFDIESKDGQTLKKIRFSNFYNKVLDSAISYLNKNIKDKIVYDKIKLEKLNTDCN